MMVVYTEKVREHSCNSRNIGEIADPDGVGEVGSPVCGDLIRITMDIDDATETITDIKFKTYSYG